MMDLLIDCTNGARKESLVRSLLDMLAPQQRADFLARFDLLGLGVDICADAPETEGEHHHDHHSLEEVLATIDALALGEAVNASVRGVYGLLAEAEAKAHGVPVDEVHFHEVGNRFAIAYIVAFCMLIDELSPQSIASTSITTGYGFVDCAHGRLPIPAPATANVLEGLPICAGDKEGELTTPTGAAMVRYFAERYV